jgi:S-methylmethionine-dependent homocysteine/selenocysteine methylase
MRDDLDVQRYTDFVLEWVELGAEIVGGCCGIGPEYISSIHKRLVEQGCRQGQGED